MPVTGDKAFGGTVTLQRDDTTLGTFNGVDLGATYNANAFIDEDISFSSADTFSPGLAITAPSLRATDAISIPTSLVQTDEGNIINLEKLYTNTIPISSSLSVPIKGSLTFNQDVTLNADSTIGSLGPSLSIPDDLILTSATEFSGRPGIQLFLFKCFIGQKLTLS